MSEELKTYEFHGEATVSVVAYVEATSEAEAQAMVDNGEVIWECDDVDGDVEIIECLGEYDE